MHAPRPHLSYGQEHYTAAYVAPNYIGAEPPKDGKQEDPHNEGIVHPGTGPNWPPENARLVYPKYYATIPVVVRGMQFEFRLSMYISAIMGCHSLAISNLEGYIEPNGVNSAKPEVIARAWGFDYKDSQYAKNTTYTLYLSRTVDSAGQKQFTCDVNTAIYEWVVENILKSKVLFFMSDRLSHHRDSNKHHGLGVTGLVNYLTKVKKWPCVASPVVANPNYFHSNATLCQGWILANRYTDGCVSHETLAGPKLQPRMAVDTAYMRNLNGLPLLKDLKKHFDDAPPVHALAAPYRTWKYMTGDWEELILKD